MTPFLGTRVGAISLRNPVLTASGTFGYGDERIRLVDPARLGGIVTKTLTITPRPGNPPRRIAETPAGMLNSIGLENVGIDAFIAERLPRLGVLDTCIVVSLAGENVAEVAEMAGRLAGEIEVDAVELNISCPNIERGGLEFANDPDAAAAMTRAVKGAFPRPVWVKLSPDASRLAEVARAVEGAGADALTLFNSFTGMAIDVSERRPLIGRGTAGLTGPAIRPLALARLWRLRKVSRLPFVGVGGISSGRDALEFLIAGASAVQVGTASFRAPSAPLRVIEEIRELMHRNGWESLEEVVGRLRVSDVAPEPSPPVVE
jgi:dihydroorotate dehydrogenase (NAD+) catalytic subunit